MDSCVMCGSMRELGPDGICLDADACVADLDAALDAHTCGPECEGAELVALLEAVDRIITPEHIDKRLRQVLRQAGYAPAPDEEAQAAEEVD